MGRQLVIAAAPLAALGVLVAAMAWSTAARGQVPEKPADVLPVERAVTELAPAKRAAGGEVAQNKRAAVKALSKCACPAGPEILTSRAAGHPGRSRR